MEQPRLGSFGWWLPLRNGTRWLPHDQRSDLSNNKREKANINVEARKSVARHVPCAMWLFSQEIAISISAGRIAHLKPHQAAAPQWPLQRPFGHQTGLTLFSSVQF